MDKVVITGIGVVSSIGIGKNNFYQALQNNVSGITHKQIGVDQFLAGVIEDTVIHEKEDRCFQFIDIACKEAIDDAGIDIMKKNDNIGIVTGTVCGNAEIICDHFEEYSKEQISETNIQNLRQYKFNSFADFISKKYNISGISVSMYNACATGLCAIHEGVNLIMNGRCEQVIVTGVDGVHAVSVYPLDSMRILDKEKIRPFDVERKGTVVGEGCGCLVLEKMECAKKRNAHIYGVVCGIGITNDAYSNVSPSLEGEGLINSMKLALSQAGISKGNIGFVNAHGTGTVMNDKTELKAIQNFFGDDVHKLIINATKSYIGHTSAAAGILGTIASLQCYENGWIHGINNLEHSIDENTNFCKKGIKNSNVDYFMSEAIGFGGVNATVIIGKYKEDMECLQTS